MLRYSPGFMFLRRLIFCAFVNFLAGMCMGWLFNLCHCH
jgi:hypothetical protein